MIRTVEIRPPSASAETLFVLRTGAVIAGLAYAAIGFRAPSPGEAPDELLPFQARFTDLDDAEQRVFRQIQEGALEAENVRSAEKAWPSVESLATEGVPPFAPDPIAEVARTWSMKKEGLIANYLGLPADPNARAYLLLIQEPDPGTSEAMNPEEVLPDEIHHRLADGKIVHVSIWTRPDARGLGGALIDKPFAEGWTQIVAGAGAGAKP